MNLRLVLLLLACASIACGGQESSAAPATQVPADAGEGASEDDGFVGCPDGGTPRFALGMRASGDSGVLAATLVAASQVPPQRYLNDWTIALSRSDGTALNDVVITRARPFMPVHGHDGIVVPTLQPLASSGQVLVRGLNFNMRGPWEVQLSLHSPSAGDDYAVFHICVAE